jgi:hypothetical protein
MSFFRRLPLLVLVFASCKDRPERTAESLVPDERDRQVLEALLLHLLADKEFDMREAAPTGTTIVLHAKCMTGKIYAPQLKVDIHGRTLPADAERDLYTRNEKAKAQAASFSDLKFAAGIVVADSLHQREKMGRDTAFPFAQAFPTARGYVSAYLPGYSEDGTQAIVRARIGPTSHGATVTAVLEKKADRWIVKWHRFAFYM